MRIPEAVLPSCASHACPAETDDGIDYLYFVTATGKKKPATGAGRIYFL